MNTDNKSYCPVPWTSFSINNNGQYRMCVQAHTHRETRGICQKDNNEPMTSDDSTIEEARNCNLLKDVRLSMLKGERHPVCQRCNEEEDAGQKSRRIVDRRRYEVRAERNKNVEKQILKSFTIEDAYKLTNTDGSLKPDSPILHTDIRLGNLCNLKCRMCGPTESSSWKSDWYHAFGSKRFRYDGANNKYVNLKLDEKNNVIIDGFDPYNWHERTDIFNELVENAPNIEIIHISGGEPTLAKAQYDLLEKLIETDRAKNISLDYNSNLVNIPDKCFDLWKHFRLVEIGGSVDGIKHVNEYIRYPSNFKKIEQALRKIDNSQNINGWFTTTVQIFNVLYIPELIEWEIAQNFKRFNINGKHIFFSMHHLHNPVYYNIRALPLEAKELVQQKYDSFLKNTLPNLVHKKKVWRHYESIKSPEYVIDVTQKCLNSITNYMWAKDESKHIDEFMDRTIALDKHRGQKFEETLPEIAQPIIKHLNSKNYFKINKIISMIGKDSYFQNKHHAVFDPKFQDSLKDMEWRSEFEAPGFWECKQEFLDTIHNWICATKLNNVKGLDRFSERDITIGTTQSFDEAYYRYKNRRLRFYRGEYHYHRRIVNNWKFIDNIYDGYEEPLDKNDWVIISLPFCGNGNKAPFYKQTLDTCHEKNIPVLIDCAWFGTCYDIDFDFNHPAITQVCFSLSKSLGLGHSRIGIRYSDFTDGSIAITNDYNHLTLSMAFLGINQMKNFSCDYIPNKYLKWHQELCEEYDLFETKCMHVALAPKKFPWVHDVDKWWKHPGLHFEDDEKYIKIGIRQALKAKRRGEL